MKRFLFCWILIYAILFTACGKTEAPKEVHNTYPDQTVDIIPVANISQNPTLPTGCETTAAVMVLQYYKEDITITDFAEYCLKKSDDFYWKNGRFYGPDPNEVFVGDPFTKSGYGCFAPVIVNAINGNSRLCQAKIVRGDLQELCHTYIDKDKPLLIWATSDMKPPEEGHRWFLENGEELIWPRGEHCLVLVGYDEDNYYFNDPLKGETVGYNRSAVETCFEALGSQAVLIDKHSENAPASYRCGGIIETVYETKSKSLVL